MNLNVEYKKTAEKRTFLINQRLFATINRDNESIIIISNYATKIKKQAINGNANSKPSKRSKKPP